MGRMKPRPLPQGALPCAPGRRVPAGATGVAFALLLVLVARCGQDTPFAWPALTRECRPWAYNWWLGSAVDTTNLTRELGRYHEAGLGGIHIIPIYGAQGAESRFVPYLTEAWMDLLSHAISEAGRHDMGVDMTTGTGWCFGGPNVPKDQGGWRLVTRVVPVKQGTPFSETLARETIVALVAEDQDGQRVDLRDAVQASGAVRWDPGDRTGRVYVVAATPGGRDVKRAAPGGAGPMINPFSRLAMTNYLARFGEAFARHAAPRPRAMYHDSFEYSSSWVPGFLDEFARRRGYRLEAQIPAFCGDPKRDPWAGRVRCDFQETLSDLVVESVFPEWTRWCRERGMGTRNQAHGAPANLLDFYALADIPETEMFGRGTRDPLRSRFDAQFSMGDREPLICKFASSAAHAAGKRLVAAETGTWMAEHFCETLEELKCLVDLLLVSGVNHVIYHGCAYSPDDAPWPGWLFYASTQMNPRNPIWRDAPTLNAYIARCQSILQSGQPDNEVALYWPLHEFWQDNGAYVSGLTVHNHQWLTQQPVGVTARTLWERGYGFDYVSDRLLATATAGTHNSTAFPGGSYRVVLVPPTRVMPVGTLQILLGVVERGATVVFQDRLPEDVPGLGEWTSRREALRATLARLSFAPAQGNVRTARHGAGCVLLGDLESALRQAGVEREPIADHAGARFIRRRHADGRHYFIANQSTNRMDAWVPLATPSAAAVWLDPMTGGTGRAQTRRGPLHRAEVSVLLEPGHSLILRTFEQQPVEGSPWPFVRPSGPPLDVQGPWRVEFVAGGPVLPQPFTLTELKSWTLSGDSETERFGGTALYRTTIEAPSGKGPWLLDLGVVCHSARVRLDGRPIGTLLMPPYWLRLPAMEPGTHTLEIEVTNLAANRIRDLDRRKVPWRVFHDANVVNIQYRPFDASPWPVFDSGLLGPVALRSSAPMPPP